jgi:hypothetical protein
MDAIVCCSQYEEKGAVSRVNRPWEYISSGSVIPVTGLAPKTVLALNQRVLLQLDGNPSRYGGALLKGLDILCY